MALIVGTLAACSTPPAPGPDDAGGAPRPTAPAPTAWPGDTGPLPLPLAQPKSRWVPVRWAELPGFSEDALHEARKASTGGRCTEVRR